MKESLIINSTFSAIAKQRPNAIDDLWPIDDFLVHIASIIFPYVRDKDFDEVKNMGLIVNAIKPLLRRKKGLDYTSLNELSLIDALKETWVTCLDDKVKLAKSLNLVEDVNDSGFVILKEKLFNPYLNSQTTRNIKYGDQNYHSQLNSKQSILQEQLPIKEIKVGIKAPKIKKWEPESEKEKELKDFWEMKHLPTSLEYGHFFWEYKIDKETYDNTKRLLIQLELNKNTRLCSKYAFHIALFLAEWFKREYDGYQCERGLDTLGLTSQKSNIIWNNSNLPDEYLINSGQDERLFSMYILGGFPVKYIARVRRFDNLFYDIYRLSKGDIIDDEIVESFSNSFDSNNSVYQASLEKGGSLYSYIEQLLDGDYPLAESDKKEEPFVTFCDILEKGKRLCFENFFSPEWLFYSNGIEGVETDVVVKIGYKKNRCYIPYDCVKSWDGVGDISGISHFTLGLVDDTGKKSKSTIRFSKTGDGDSPFVGWGTNSSLSMDVDIAQVNNLDVVMYLPDNKEINIYTIAVRNHYQIYQTENSYCWSTNKNIMACSALLYNTTKYKIVESPIKPIELILPDENRKGWCWVIIIDNIIIEEVTTGKEYNFSKQRGKLGVIFKEDNSIKQNIVEYTYCDEDENKVLSVPIMYGINGINSVKLYPFEPDKKPESFKIKDCIIEYKQEVGKYDKLNKEHQPDCGLTNIRVQKGDLRLETICYFIPLDDDRSLVVRDLKKREIRFRVDDVQIWSEGPNGDFKLMKEKKFDDTQYDNRPEDCIPFRIGTDESYITIEVFRAKDCREIYYNGQLLKQSGSDKAREVPMILKDKFKIRTINGNGVSWDSLEEHKLLDFHFINNDGTYKTISEAGNDSGTLVYLYKDKHKWDRPLNILKISPDHVSQYDFYFWAIEESHDPIKLSYEYDADNKELKLPDLFYSGSKAGMIFQSLKGDVYPPNYSQPYYSSWSRLLNRNFTESINMKCLELAAEHHIYFSQFPPLYKLVESVDAAKQLIALALEYMEEMENSGRNAAHDLHRFADEFLFDWMLLPVQLWKAACRDSEKKRKNAEKLFRYKPHVNSAGERSYLNMIIQKYWSISSRWEVRGRRPEAIALKFIKGTDKDYYFFGKKKTKLTTEYMDTKVLIGILQGFRASDRFYYNLYQLICKKLCN